MSTFFRVESRDINDLDALQLTKLLKILLHSEAKSYGIKERAVEVALNINVPDGGEDGRIEWNDGPLNTDYLPCRLVQFQIKAKDMTPAKCAEEIINKDKSIKSMIEEVLDNDGAYILFYFKELNKSQKKERIKKIRKKLTELGKINANTAIIDIYDASKIEGWVNKYLSAIVAVLNWVGRPLAHGLKTWSEWSQYEYTRFPFIADESRRNDLKELRKLFKESRKCARIIGLSGLGKTRLALEVFMDVEENDDYSKRAVYIDVGADNSISGLVSDWVRYGLEGVIVADNCDISIHDRLRQEVQHIDSKLSLLTLDYNFERAQQTQIVQLNKLSDSHIKQILEPFYGKKISDLDRIISFAQGFPQMAVLLADARLDKEPDIGRLNDDNLAQKMLWGGQNPVEREVKILKGCALFDRFGLENEVSNEYEFIAEKIVDVSLDDFYDCVKKFEKRGLIDRRGRYGRLVPKPLAIRLAAEWWSRTRPEKQMELIQSAMPGGLIESFCNQISYLDFLPEVKNLTEELCGPQGPFGQAEVILSNRGSLLFRYFVEVNPDITSKALANILNPMTEKELLAISGDVRRNLVWALEKLCFHKSCFEESANSLLLLASAENESWSNNATGQFKQLFKIFLSGTEAPPSQRIKVIDSILNNERNSIRKMAFVALDQIIDTYSGSRMIGAEYQGSGAPLEEWRPKVWGEAFEYLEQALDRLCNLVLEGNILSNEAKSSIGRHIRGLLQYGRVNEIDTVIKKIVESEGQLWPEAIDSIKDSLRYDSEKMPEKIRETLKEWINLLTPDKIGDRLKLYISNPPYEHEKGESGHYIDIAAKNAKSLAEEVASDLNSILPFLDDLLIGEQRQAYWFGKNLVQSSCKWELLLEKVIDKITTIESPNISFLIGLLNGVFNCNASQWEYIIKKFSETESLIPYYPNVINSGDVTSHQLDCLIHLIIEKKIDPINVNIFVYGKSLEHLSYEIVCNFVHQLAAISDNAAWVAFDILSMYCYGKQDKWELCRPTFNNLVINLSLVRPNKYVNSAMYQWHDVVEKLLGSEGEEFAKAISKKIIESCLDEIDYSVLRFSIKPILRKIFQQYGREVWPIFSETIKNIDTVYEHRLVRLLQSEDMFNNKKVSVLGDLPDDLLREWCIQEPEIAPLFVAQATDILDEINKNYEISPRAKFLIDNFGDNKQVLSYLSENLGTFGWSGSLVPYYKKELDALITLKTHENKKVREWANQRIEYLLKRIEIEERRDKEHEWGIY